MKKIVDVLLEPCPFCKKQVELWSYQECIKSRFICTGCKVEFEFPKGFDTKECIKLWNGQTKHSKAIPENSCLKTASKTICMDEGPNQFKEISYIPTCHCDYDDCVFDPAYIKATYPSWYHKLYGSKLPEEVSCKNQGTCKNGERYDDEDK